LIYAVFVRSFVPPADVWERAYHTTPATPLYFAFCVNSASYVLLLAQTAFVQPEVGSWRVHFSSFSKSLTMEKPSLARGYFFMVCLALQFGLQPLFTKACIHENAHKPSLVLLCEIMKMFLALILLFLDPTCKKVLEKWSLRETFSKAGVPAAVYAFQNVCIQVSYQNTDPLTFNLLNQLKIVFTAIMVYVLLGKTQTGQQIIALFLLLVVGVVLCLPEGVLTGDIESSFAAIQGKNDFMYGIVPCLVASICSGFASAYSQMVMSGKGQRNAYLFSAELSFCSGLFLLAGNIYTSIINGNNGGSSSLKFSNFINI
jgi:UDP-sugar transporter A1/2/3